MKVEGDTIRLTFTHAQGLTTQWPSPICRR
jgi:hypothetical protein